MKLFNQRLPLRDTGFKLEIVRCAVEGTEPAVKHTFPQGGAGPNGEFIMSRRVCHLLARSLPGIHERFGIGEELFAGGRQADVITMTGEQIHQVDFPADEYES